MLKSKFLLFLLGIGGWASAQTTIVDSIFHGGMYRNYRLYVPAIYSGAQPVPLVLNLHGYTSNASQQQLYGNFMPIADTANFLVVHPNGTNPGTGQFWNAGFTSSPDDIGFLETLMDTLSAQYNINQDRIYTTGMSNGGIMSYYLSCGLYNRITAMASVTGTMTNVMYATCNPPGPIPVMEIHGTADGTVPYNGSSTSMHIDSVIKFWRLHNTTDASPVVIPYANTSTTDGCTATEYAYLNGTMGSEVVLVKINSGGHTWPGAPVDIGVTNHDFSASIRIWEFFRRFEKSQFVGINEKTASGNILNVYPNPVSGTLTIEGTKAGENMFVYNLQGLMIYTGKTADGKSTIDMGSFVPGLYTIMVGSGTSRIVKL